MKHVIPSRTVLDVLEASGLFESRSEIRKSLKNKSIKINNIVVDDLEEKIEHGDFLNFVWLCGGADLVQQHGPVFLSVSAGKKWSSKCILRLVDTKFDVWA